MPWRLILRGPGKSLGVQEAQRTWDLLDPTPKPHTGQKGSSPSSKGTRPGPFLRWVPRSPSSEMVALPSLPIVRACGTGTLEPHLQGGCWKETSLCPEKPRPHSHPPCSLVAPCLPPPQGDRRHRHLQPRPVTWNWTGSWEWESASPFQRPPSAQPSGPGPQDG